MLLVVFDIDGTLCDTEAVDEDCFVRACAGVFGVVPQAVDWELAPHVTDSSISDWWCRQTLGRAPTAAETTAVVDRFLASLEQALAQAPERFRPVPGAPALLRRIHTLGWRTGVATGGWGRSARLKLAAAGLPEVALLACSDDASDRVEIFRLAQQRALADAAGPVARTVLVGDGAWDVRVAGSLGWSFVGVAEGRRAERLMRAGAVDVIPHFLDVDHALRVVERAAAPVRVQQLPEAAG